MSTVALPSLSELEQASEFCVRHVGIVPHDESAMLQVIGADSRQALVDALMPPDIKRLAALDLPAPCSEHAALVELKRMAAQNQTLKSYIGQGYYGTVTPAVILRNVLESPAWYTAYTPYQAEISQGRLEALLNFQTMVCDLTGLAIANASMLDEATSAAEAMALAARVTKQKSRTFYVADDVLPQTLEVVRTRAQPLGFTVQVGPAAAAGHSQCFAALLQYPGVNGELRPLNHVAEALHAHGALLIVAADLLALTLLKSPGEQGADIAVGTTQRFGMPMGNGGPHAAYIACKDEFKRALPGRLVGVSIDGHGKPAYRLTMQTREQHIRRERATSNICTAQVLPAVVASMYAVYHGPDGLRRIARRIAAYTALLARELEALGLALVNSTAFDTLEVRTGARTEAVHAAAVAAGMNFRRAGATSVSISLDETTTRADLEAVLRVFANSGTHVATEEDLTIASRIPRELCRTSAYLTHPVFNKHHSETEMLRYLRALADKDLALDRSMIPLGSCTMKLNATSEMIPVTWPEFAHIHPFAPAEQRRGYDLVAEQLSAWLCQLTGYAGVSLQPNAGSQGEYAGLLIIRAWHESRGDAHRKVCLIPESAHGTNPASAQMAGMEVVVTRCARNGSIDLADLRSKCAEHSANLAAIMITYPSTYGLFDTQVKEICALVRRHGGRVYVDGANMNALIALAAPGEFGGDVSHLNLHKTFCIPHGGGGPGVGPVCVVEDLVPYLPALSTAEVRGGLAIGAVAAAPLGNASVLPISWMYVRMMGAAGLRAATETAVLSANYVAARLSGAFGIQFSGNIAGISGGGVAHECILDLRPLEKLTGIGAEDVAKRLIDYGFHAPTLSFPVAGTLMVEPTESEARGELDRFCDAMLAIRAEIARVEQGTWTRDDNPLVNAPHTAESLLAAEWTHGYSREEAAYPVASLRAHKYWVPVGRVDNVFGDRNLFCSCAPIAVSSEAVAYEDRKARE